MPPLNACENNWYILYTFPNYEKKIYSSLIKKDINVFLPTQKVRRQWSDRTKIVEVPLFPNYLFININEKNRFQVFEIYGVKHYITFEGKAAVISENDIQCLKKIMEHPFVNEQRLVTGDVVKVIEGPFKDLVGVFFRKTGQRRFGIRIESINQTISINLLGSLIKKI